MVGSFFRDNYGEGTQNLVCHQAFKYSCSNIERHTQYYGTRGLYATMRYIWIYIPQDGIDDNVVAVSKGCNGCSKTTTITQLEQL